MQRKGVLSQVYTKLIEVWNPAKIKSTWKYDTKYIESRGISTNLQVFLKNYKSGKETKAAFLTPTGRVARSNGFNHVDVNLIKDTHGNIIQVDATFTQ